MSQAKLLLVDDEAINLKVLRNILQAEYELVFAKNGDEAISLAQQHKPSLILLDVMMPGKTGFDVCAELKGSPELQNIPVIFVTALKDELDEAKAFELGAVDYINKPVTPAVVKARVKTHLSLVQAQELKETRLRVIERLGRAAEYKDNETGLHVLRMSHYAHILALAYGLTPHDAENLLHAAPMHDIGKIGIPDNILLKPGRLTDEEYAIMQTHPEIGAQIIGECSSDLFIMAKTVALYHHEKWDGSGYPFGLRGEQIPLEARIVAVADVFDALTSARPYKPAWSLEKTLEHMQQQKGLHFEPKLIDLLIEKLPDILAIKERWAEHTPE